MTDAKTDQFEMGRVVSDVGRNLEGILPSVWPLVAGFAVPP